MNTQNTCLKCTHFFKQPEGESPPDGGYCRYLPPVTHMLPVPNRISGELVYQGRTMFPMVGDDSRCSKFELKALAGLDS